MIETMLLFIFKKRGSNLINFITFSQLNQFRRTHRDVAMIYKKLMLLDNTHRH